MKSNRRTENLKGSSRFKIEKIVRQYPTDKAVEFAALRRAEHIALDRKFHAQRGGDAR